MVTFEVWGLVRDWPVKQSQDKVSLKKQFQLLFLSERQLRLEAISCFATMVSPPFGLYSYHVLHL